MIMKKDLVIRVRIDELANGLWDGLELVEAYVRDLNAGDGTGQSILDDDGAEIGKLTMEVVHDSFLA
jgi:hypothetical protein